MGKGDRRSRKGKIWRGSFGKHRMKLSNLDKPSTGAEDTGSKAKAEKTPKKKPAARKKKAE